ncbi:hypothetical protein NE237_020679 [Protea cynaroides]|uniref:ATP-cone domain-containing protein n=1 Tax=Protea cynaroides TaxID=273540 RepID=A0A9Q0K1W5_9MAGN|nr:hypothetical protein NE237_020679 [Protea cynaroides]
MYVVKRDGRQETVHFDKITARLKKLSYGLNVEHCDPVLVAQKVCAGVYKGVTTSQLDEWAAETTAAMTANHPNYSSLAARIVVSNLYKNTKKSFSETIKIMDNHVNEESGLKAPLVADDVYEMIIKQCRWHCSSSLHDNQMGSRRRLIGLMRTNGRKWEEDEDGFGRVKEGNSNQDARVFPATATVSALPNKQREPKETSIDLERLAFARKRFHENYLEATNAKKQRKIQVMDHHDIPKPKNSFFGKKGGYQAKHW